MRIHIRQSDDWIAIYKDGRRVFNNHSVSLTEFLDMFNIEYTYEWEDPEDDIDDMSWFFIEELEN